MLVALIHPVGPVLLLSPYVVKWTTQINRLRVLEIFFTLQSIRWTMFTIKWKKKLKKSRLHTHLACNQNEAIAEKDRIEQDAQNAKTKTKEAIKNAQEDFLKLSSKRATVFNFPSFTWPSFFARAYGQGDTLHKSETKALGLVYGTTAFEEFLKKRNRNWFLQAQDVSPYVNLKINEGRVNLSPLDSMTDYTGKKMKKEGFPVPETRINTTGKMVGIVQDNLNQTEISLKLAWDRYATYKELVTKAKERLTLGEKGLGDTYAPTADPSGDPTGDPSGNPTTSPPTPVKKVHCATGSGDKITFGTSCKCRKNNSCAKFTIPKDNRFSSAPSSAKSKGKRKNKDFKNLGKAISGIFSGNLKNANTISEQLFGKSNRLFTPNSSSGMSSLSRRPSGKGVDTLFTVATSSAMGTSPPNSTGDNSRDATSKGTSSTVSTSSANGNSLAKINNLSSSSTGGLDTQGASGNSITNQSAFSSRLMKRRSSLPSEFNEKHYTKGEENKLIGLVGDAKSPKDDLVDFSSTDGDLHLNRELSLFELISQSYQRIFYIE